VPKPKVLIVEDEESPASEPPVTRINPNVAELTPKFITIFPKAHRYILGGKIEDYFLGILENIFISIYLPPETKIPRLTIVISKLDGVKFFLQIAWENKCVKDDNYSLLSEHLQEIGRMLGGCKKGLEKKTPPVKNEGEKF
jgi:hypothetical protein